MNIKPILGTAVGLQSIAVLGRAYKTNKEVWRKKKRIQKGKMIKGFTDIMVGTALIKPTAELVEEVKW